MSVGQLPVTITSEDRNFRVSRGLCEKDDDYDGENDRTTASLKKEKEIKFDIADVTLITLPLTPHDRALTTHG